MSAFQMRLLSFGKQVVAPERFHRIIFLSSLLPNDDVRV